MNGASTAIGAAGAVYPAAERNSPHQSQGASHARPVRADSERGGTLASAQRVVSESLGSAGFVDLTASFNDNVVRSLRYHPMEAEIEDLKPGMLDELLSWARSKIAMDASLALAAQARVSSEAAIKLLT